MGPWGEFLYHRGPTHALWFGPLAGSVLGYAVWRGYASKYRSGTEADEGVQNRETENGLHPPGHPALLTSWIGLFVLTLLSQPFLDVFTTYGTQLFTPFSNKRFALDAVPIIDPAYSLILIAALVIWSRTTPKKRVRVGRRAAAIALILSTGYLFYGLWLNERAAEEVRRQLAAGGVAHAQVRVYPTIFQVYLRRVVVRVDNEVLVGAITMWKPGPVQWHRFTVPKHPMIDKLAETDAGRIFEWFAAGEVVPRVIELNDGFLVELDDVRYGFFQAPDQGIWGIRGKFDPDGNLQGEVVRFRRHFDVGMETFVNLWRASFGLIPEVPHLDLSEGRIEKGESSGLTTPSQAS
jgi:inner membrane protein